MTVTMEKIVNFAKTQGFVYQGSEIYGGLANTWDYGPLGVEVINNIKKMWWKHFIQLHAQNVGIDSAIFMNSQTWVTSGHVDGFSDPLIDCKNCKTRHRADHLIEDFTHGEITGDGWSKEKLEAFIDEHNIPCPNCGKHDFTPIRQFNLMFETQQGVVDDAKNQIFLRPETAQGIFVNFKNVQRTSRKKIPFGIGQIGKAFRNEITPGNFIFRTREFEQMELEFFCAPDTDIEWQQYWRDYCFKFLLALGISEDNLRMHDHSPEELAHYSKATTDIQYKFPFGFGELWGISDRTDFDLRKHMEASGTSMEYLDPITNEKYIPYCIEPSVGVGRLFLALLVDAYQTETLDDGTNREVLKLHPSLTTYKVAILPLTKKLSDKATSVYKELAEKFMVDYDEAGTIGKRYRRQDAIGTKYCVTVDFDTLDDDAVTIRDRDTMEQVRVAITDLPDYIEQSLTVQL